MTVLGDLQQRIETNVRIYEGERSGFTFFAVNTFDLGLTGWGWRLSPPVGVDTRTVWKLDIAMSYWGSDELPALARHLQSPAPRHAWITGWNDDAWIASEDSGTIYYMMGFDGPSDCECYDLFPVPARPLHDYILDFTEASAEHRRGTSGALPRSESSLPNATRAGGPVPGEWGPEGEHDHEVAMAVVLEPDETWGTTYVISGQDERRTTVTVSAARRITIEGGAHVGTDGTSARTFLTEELDAHCMTLDGWPSRMPGIVLIDLYAPEICAAAADEWEALLGL